MIIDLVIGLGEIGTPIHALLSRTGKVAGYDKNPRLNTSELFANKGGSVRFMNVCFGYTSGFEKAVLIYIKTFKPEVVVIHSTVKPGTTKNIQTKTDVPIIYSPVRGVHATMQEDMLYYTKFYSFYPQKRGNSHLARKFEKRFSAMKVKRASSPLVLEWAKPLADTSYLGWLIAYAQYTNWVCIREQLDYDELWEFAAEIHKKLGNRPKLFAGVIRGHCVNQNIELLEEEFLNLVPNHNKRYEEMLIVNAIPEPKGKTKR